MAAKLVTKAAIFLILITFSVARQFPDFLEASRRPQLLADTWQHLDKVWRSSFDQQWLESVMENNSLHQSLESAVSPRCFYDLMIWINSLRKGEMWAVQLFDATGKLPPGVLKGNLLWLGNYEECRYFIWLCALLSCCHWESVITRARETISAVAIGPLRSAELLEF